MWSGFDPFRPVENHIGSGAGNPAHCYVRFGPRRWPSRSAHSHLQLLFFSSTYGSDWSLCVVVALASLRFQRNAQDYEETRQGMTVFAGDAASFHEWQFLLHIKKSVCKAEELPALTAKVVDALRGEALSCAMEIGLAKLMEADGLDLLVQKVQERLFQQRTAEAAGLSRTPLDSSPLTIVVCVSGVCSLLRSWAVKCKAAEALAEAWATRVSTTSPLCRHVTSFRFGLCFSRVHARVSLAVCVCVTC